MSTEREVEVQGEALLSDNCIIIPADLPAGSVITITITIGPKVEPPKAPAFVPAICPRCDLNLNTLPDRPSECPRCGYALQ